MTIVLYSNIKNAVARITGVARKFDWRGPEMAKFCNVILVMFFGDAIMTF